MVNLIEKASPDILSRVIAAMENGGRLTAEVLAYVDATLFSPVPDHLADYLKDDGDSQRDSLLDLIFYPDETVQIDMEPLLAAARYSASDEAVLAERLMARAVDVQLTMPDGLPLVQIRLPGDIKRQYLRRLNISWQIDPEVSAVIESKVSPACRPVVGVRLRNADLRFTSDRRSFLCRFFAFMDDHDPDYPDCLSLVLSLMGSAGEGDCGYDLLAGHKRFLFRSLQQANRFESLIRQSNMETLMLQGLRAPHAAPDALMRQMHLIDRICLTMFGTTETIAQLIDEPVREITDLEDPDAALNLKL
jgi:hypothetical protein